MYPSSHSRAALSSPESVSFVTFPWGAFGAADFGLGPDFAHTGPTPASESRPSKCERHHKLYFPGLLESPSSVMYFTL